MLVYISKRKPPNIPPLLFALRYFATSINWSNFDNLFHEKEHQVRIEKHLEKFKENLDHSCVVKILQKCSIDRSLRLRFFVWSGVQSNYKHSALMYKEVCKFLQISQYPETIDDLFESYKKEVFFVSIKMFKVIFNICKEAQLEKQALGLLKKMREFDCRPDTVLYNLVIKIFSARNKMDVVKDLIQEMSLAGLHPDLITYIEMIKGFCDVGQLDVAHKLLREMKDHGCDPNIVAYSTFFHSICKSENFDLAFRLLDEMERECDSLKPNVITYTSLIQVFCETGRSMEGLKVLNRMLERGCHPNDVTVRTLVKGFCLEGCIHEAHCLIEKVVKHGSVSAGQCYSSLVMTLLQMKNILNAEKIAREVMSNGIILNSITCNSLIMETCLKGSILDAFKWYQEFNKLDLSINIDTHYSLLTILCRDGHFIEATVLVNIMADRRIKLKSHQVYEIVELLRQCDQNEMAYHIKSFQS